MALADEHRQTYGAITQYERLQCLNTTAASFKRLQQNLNDRLDRESCIPAADILHAVQQIVQYPYLGGQKGSLKLQHDEQAYLGSTTYQDIKQLLKLAAAETLVKRQEQHEKSELQQAQYRRYEARTTAFAAIEPQQKHEVWAIDFLKIMLFGSYFQLCVVYEVYSQGYLAITPAREATAAVAEQALVAACHMSGQIPKKCLLSDNGAPLTSQHFAEIKARFGITSQFIPPGQPWYNGALESGNRDLRQVIYTSAFYAAAENPQLSKRGADAEQLDRHLATSCHQTQQIINEQIVRPKFNTTPQAVWKDEVEANQQRRRRYIEQKKQQRQERMAQLKITGGTTRKRIEDKVAAAWTKVAHQLNTEQLFAFSEMINKRYRAIII